ncbi:hypothetical protein FSP39_007410, partial [Pinctada imbricata]
TDSKIGEQTPLEKGASSLFDLTHSFLDSVQGTDFISDNNAAITFRDIETIISNGTYDKLQGRWQDMAKVFGGYAACVIFGLLFIIAMPIAGLLFCCCYACCKCCGRARSKEDPPNAKCKRTTYCFLLAVMATMMLAGGIVAIISNEVLHDKLTNSDDRGTYQYLQSGIKDLVDFADETQTALITTTVNTVDSTVTDIINKVNDVTESLASLTDVETGLDTLNNLASTISNTLMEIERNITQECADAGIPQCPVPSLSLGPDFSGLSNLSDVARSVAQSVNVSQLTTQARGEFNKTINEVNSQVTNSIADAQRTTEQIKTDVNREINTINDTVQPLVDRLRNLSTEMQKENQKLMNDKYFDYVWYGGIGASCLIILMVLFYYMGILFGICGERPGRGSPCCNRGAGSSCIVAGVVFSFFFSWILMLVCLLLFIPGGFLYTNVCRNLNRGVENVYDYETILESYGIAVKKILYKDNPNATFTLGHALRDCKANMGLYTALKLDNLFNLDEAVNTSKVLEEIDKLNVNGFNIGNVNIIPPDLNNSLNNFANSGILNINFTSFDDQLGKTPVINLTETINSLLMVGLNNSAESLRQLQNGALRNLSSQMATLQQDLRVLRNKSDLQEEVKNLTDGLLAAQDRFNNQSNTLVKTELDNTINEIKNTVNTTLEGTKSKVRNEIGQCRPVYTATQKLSDAFCVVLLDPFNSFWFGLGWGLFFFIPSIIFGLLLANLYQREEPLDKETRRAMKRSREEAKRNRDFENPEMDQYQGYNGRADDNIPLTSVDRNGYHGNKGIPNAGYGDGHGYRDHYEGDRYYRDHHPPSYHDSRHYPPASYGQSQGGYPRGSYDDGYRGPSARPRY